MKIKIGKYKNCVKKLIRYGFTEEAAKITCGNVAITDTDWEVKKKKIEKSGFEMEEEEEEEEFGKRTTQAGEKTKPEKRTIITEPKAMQMPLYQPWRSYKSEHRLQTKLEKVQTAEQKFLTMEQLLKRAEYALAIKKKDADPFMVYMIPEELWDQTIKQPKLDEKTGLPITRWISRGGQRIPIVMTREGEMTQEAALEKGIKASPITTIGKRLKERVEAGKGELPFADPKTEKEKEAIKSAERDKELNLSLKVLEKTTFEFKSPYQKLRERQEKIKSERMSPIERPQEITKEQISQMEGLEKQVENIEGHSSFQQIGTDPTEAQPDWDNLPEEDLWAYVSRDLNFTLKGTTDEYAKIRASMGISPIIYGERRNVIHEMEALSRISNPYVLDDFIVHTKNYLLKEQAMNRLKEVDNAYYEKNIVEKVKMLKKAKTTYKIDPESKAYQNQKNKFDIAQKMKEEYMIQGAGGSHEYFTTKQELGERNYPDTYAARQLGMKPDKEGGKTQNPDAGYQTMEELGLIERGKDKEGVEYIRMTTEITPEEREMEKFLKKAKS